jgi:hypothetical protein
LPGPRGLSKERGQARIARGSAQLSRAFPRHAAFLGLDQREKHPSDDRQPLLVAAVHDRSQGLLRNEPRKHAIAGIAMPAAARH